MSVRELFPYLLPKIYLKYRNQEYEFPILPKYEAYDQLSVSKIYNTIK
jgi:hypothetical protein